MVKPKPIWYFVQFWKVEKERNENFITITLPVGVCMVCKSKTFITTKKEENTTATKKHTHASKKGTNELKPPSFRAWGWMLWITDKKTHKTEARVVEKKQMATLQNYSQAVPWYTTPINKLWSDVKGAQQYNATVLGICVRERVIFVKRVHKTERLCRV